MQTREWEKDGIKRYSTEVVVDMQGTMQLLGGRSNQNQEIKKRAHDDMESPGFKPLMPAQSIGKMEIDDDDIPF